jgi:hypothetical protein
MSVSPESPLALVYITDLGRNNQILKGKVVETTQGVLGEYLTLTQKMLSLDALCSPHNGEIQ